MSERGPGLGCMGSDTTCSKNDIIVNLYRDTEHDNTMMTEQDKHLYWLCEKLLLLQMYWVVLHVCCVTMLLKQPIHARYLSRCQITNSPIRA